MPSERRTVLLVGAGGIGAPCALALAHAEPASGLRLLVADDDVVERSNLHRQILFSDADVGVSKLEALGRALRARGTGLAVSLHEGRLVTDVAVELASRADVVIDASDNFATRFLTADAAHLARRPLVTAAAVRWQATVVASAPSGRPCYRCLFEDLPEGPVPDCATAGVVGPVCGVAGALAAELALRVLRGADGDASPYGFVHTYDGRRDRLRRVPFAARHDCALCGRAPSIVAIAAERYVGPACEAELDAGGP